MENNENKELTEEQKREKAREYAIETLKDAYITNMASAAFGEPQKGQMPKYGVVLSQLYDSTIEQDPNSLAFDALYKEDLKNGGAVTKESLMKRAKAIITYSLMAIKPQDILQLVGSKEATKNGYEDKMVGELEEEDQKNVLNLYANYMANEKVNEVIHGERKALVGGLEGILCTQKQSAQTQRQPARAPVRERRSQPAQAA